MILGETTLYADSFGSDESQASQVMKRTRQALLNAEPPQSFMTAGFRLKDNASSGSNTRSGPTAPSQSESQQPAPARADSMKENTPAPMADIPGLAHAISLVDNQAMSKHEGQKQPVRPTDVSFVALASETETPPASQLFQTPRPTPTSSAPQDNPRSQSPILDDYFPSGQAPKPHLTPPEPATPTASQPSTPTGLRQLPEATASMSSKRSLFNSLAPEKQQRYLERRAVIMSREQETQPSTISDARATGPSVQLRIEEPDVSDTSIPDPEHQVLTASQEEDLLLSAIINAGNRRNEATQPPPTQELDTSGFADTGLIGNQGTQATQEDASYYPDTGLTGPPSPQADSPVHQPIVMEETQIAEELSHYPTTGLSENVDDVAAHDAPASELRHADQQPSHRTPPRRGPDYSDMDIVPDSEATQPCNEELIPSPPLSPAPSHADISMQSISEEIALDSHAGPNVVHSNETAGDDSDSDEDDVPLAASASRRPSKKRLQKEPSGSLMPPPKRMKLGSPSNPDHQLAGHHSTGEVVPSSCPQDDPLQTVDEDGLAKRTKKKPSTPSTPSKRRRPRDITPDESDDTGSVLAKTEVCTEAADDDYMEMNESTKTAGTRKRRGNASTRSSIRKSRTVSTTPSVRSTRKTKSASKSFTTPRTPRANSAHTVRVFAMWKQDSHYYVGTADYSSSSSDGKYLVRFDDGTSDTIDIRQMRRCEPRTGDHVTIISMDRKGVIADVSPFESEGIVQIRCSKNDDILEVHVSDIRVASRSITSQWKDRTVADVDIKPRLNETPTPSNMSDVNAWSSRTKKLFSKMGVVLSASAGNQTWPKIKTELTTLIRDNGGVVYEDWCEVFKMDGAQSANGNRLVFKKEEIELVPKDKVDRVFLLGDDASHKVKYLIALALGIPCVHVDWIRHQVDEQNDKDWQPYLLSAGTSVVLGARVSQMVDLDWGACPAFVEDITNNQVAMKLFADKVILCVSTDYVPGRSTGRKRSADEEKATRSIPRIVLCMGASEVEAVADARTATRGLHEYDYVVVKDAAAVRRIEASHPDATVVHVPWVKECLITGRLLPTNHPQLPTS